MNVSDVISTLVEEGNFEKDRVIEIVCEGVLFAYSKKYPGYDFQIQFNQSLGQIEVFVKKTIVKSVQIEMSEISNRKASSISPSAKEGDEILVPFERGVGRVEVAAAKNIIASRMREVEQLAVYEEFVEKKGQIVSGVIHKKERRGIAVKMGSAIALLSCPPGSEAPTARAGSPVRALLRNVYKEDVRGYQLHLDRSSAEFVKKLLESEIPEVFEGEVEIKGVVRSPGYKTKILVHSHSSEIDSVGACVGVGGGRIKPILKEIGAEKIDLIEWSSDIETLVKSSLKPAEIDKVELYKDGKATVWLAEDQRALAIGKRGQNILLASRLVGVEIQLQEVDRSGRREFEGEGVLDGIGESEE